MNLICWEREVTFSHSAYGSLHRVNYPLQKIKFFQITPNRSQPYKSILENELRSNFFSCKEAEVLALCETCGKECYGKETVLRVSPAQLLMFSFIDKGITIGIDEIKKITAGGINFELYCVIKRTDMINEYAHYCCICREGDSWVEYNDSRMHALSWNEKFFSNCYILVYVNEQLSSNNLIEF